MKLENRDISIIKRTLSEFSKPLNMVSTSELSDTAPDFQENLAPEARLN